MAPLKRNRSFKGAEVLSLLRDAGFAGPNLLQQKVLPLIMAGKNVAVEAPAGSGKTAAFILPMVFMKRGEKAGIKAVVLTSSAEKSLKAWQEFKSFARGRNSGLTAAVLGLEEDGRKEQRKLSASPDILIATPDKVIDHIRRGNLEFSQLQRIVIDEPQQDECPEFAEDVRFIFSKLPPCEQTLLFSPQFQSAGDPLLALLRRPVMVPACDWAASAPTAERIFVTASESRKPQSLSNLLLAWNLERTLVLCAQQKQVPLIFQELKARQLPALQLEEGLPAAGRQALLNEFRCGRTPILLASYRAVPQPLGVGAAYIVCYDLPPNPAPFFDPKHPGARVIALGSSQDYLHLKEQSKVQIHQVDQPSEDQVLSGSIRRIMERLEEEGTGTLRPLRLAIRRQVPFWKRSWLSAYLLHLSLGGRKSEPEALTRLFISVGKSRRVYAKDLKKLFCERLQLSEESIGPVKVLDNYSFIEIPPAQAGKAIAQLSGIDFKGKKISVNYARKREDKGS